MELFSFRDQAVLDYSDEPFVVAIPTSRHVRKIALIGNSLPRRCGIATYSTDILQAITDRFPDVIVDLWAMNDSQDYDYSAAVTGTIEQDNTESYRIAARAITASAPDMVWLQHEFGIFEIGRASCRERVLMPV